MMMKTLRKFLWAGLVASAVACPAQAARILFLDAAMPGSDPTSVWEDLSPSGYDFNNSPTSPATYNAANLTYDFEFTNRMDGVGNESLFDFETAYGDPFPDGNPVPFSIVAFIDQDWSAGVGGFAFVSKTDESGDGQFLGWILQGNQDFSKRFDFSMQPGNNVDRLYARTEDGFSQGSSGSPMLVVVTHTGFGQPSLDVAWYVNGVQVPTVDVNDALDGTVLNNNQLVLGQADIGSGGDDNEGFQGSILFLEIHDVVLTPEEVAARWNGGAVERVGQPLPVVSTTVTPVTSVQSVTFDTLSGLEYVVQHNDDAIGSNWISTSKLVGNGGSLRAFDFAADPTPERIFRFLILIQ